MAVGGFDGQTALAVDGAAGLERADEHGALGHRLGDHGAQSPQRRVLHDAAIAVLSGEETTAEILAVRIL